MPDVDPSLIPVLRDPIPPLADATIQAIESVNLDLQPVVSLREPPVDEDAEVAVATLLDQANVAVFVNGQSINTEGRLRLALEQRATAMKAAAASQSLVMPNDDLIKAKSLLMEAFPWLRSFDGSADLRQRIKLFVG